MEVLVCFPARLKMQVENDAPWCKVLQGYVTRLHSVTLWFHGGSMVVPWWFHGGSMVLYSGSMVPWFQAQSMVPSMVPRTIHNPWFSMTCIISVTCIISDLYQRCINSNLYQRCGSMVPAQSTVPSMVPRTIHGSTNNPWFHTQSMVPRIIHGSE
jgi:hypothetical protein